MIEVAVTRTMPPAMWTKLANGVWVHVTALDDPLLRAELHRVTVHRDEQQRVWVWVAGNNAGVRVQSVPPDQHDFADVDGGRL